RKVQAIHGHSAVSYGAIRQELELASGMDLAPFFNAWLEQPGRFDYAIGGLKSVPGGVRIVIDNAGDLPAPGELDIALVMDSGVDVRRVAPGAQGGAFVFSTAAPLRRVILDPEFITVDMNRANNTWPRQGWPVFVAASADGRIAVAAKEEWCAAGPGRVAVWNASGDAYQKLNLGQALTAPPSWAPSGHALLLAAHTPCWWDGGDVVVLPDEAGSGPWRAAGWKDAETVMLAHSDPPRWRAFGRGGALGGGAPCGAVPAPGSLVPNPVRGCAVYIAEDTGEAHVLDFEGPEPVDALAARGLRPAGHVGWTADGQRLVFLDRQGRLFAMVPGPGTPEPQLELGYAVQDARVSGDGSRVAWIDPAGALRVLEAGAGEKKYVDIPGEVVAYDWQGSEALVCLTATAEGAFPMRCHARYALWRAPAATLRGEPMKIDPARVH
ncbi:MAG: hypothetical protein JXR94_04210, partial [Candidatus Hydrogenedentes bacterium]|nr:hypothetical protein [Candidatus Hydrogenedentota bacterium]